MEEDGGGTGQVGLREVSGALKRRMGRRTDRRARIWRIWSALHGAWSSRVNDRSSGSIEAMIVVPCMNQLRKSRGTLMSALLPSQQREGH